MGIICFSVFLAEGTVLDWSAVFLTEIRDVAESNGGLGFATFALAMTFARLIGDRIITGLGAIPVVIAGALIAAAGFALVLFIPDWKISPGRICVSGPGLRKYCSCHVLRSRSTGCHACSSGNSSCDNDGLPWRSGRACHRRVCCPLQHITRSVHLY